MSTSLGNELVVLLVKRVLDLIILFIETFCVDSQFFS